MSKKDSYKPGGFWPTQPVPQNERDVKQANLVAGPIDEVKDPEKDIRATPLDLPPGFEWSVCDILDDATSKEVYELLYGNYVEDDDAMFRFDYSIPFLQWALTPPGHVKDWILGVRVTTNKKLVGFISGIPVGCHIYDYSTKMAEINFLCVHKKLRSKRLAPVLIKEVTRRVNRTGIFQAVYTAGVRIPTPVSECRYWHRSLNPKKLIDIGFSHKKQNWSMKMHLKFYACPTQTVLPIIPMEARHLSSVRKILNAYLSKFSLHVDFDEDEVAHWLLPRQGVIYSYVVEDPATKEVTDFCSFYSLPSTIIGNAQYKTLNAAYSYYHVATKSNLKTVINDALIMAAKNGFDVFNALDVMENDTVLKDLKFGVGDGNLQYYLYNWKCKPMPAKQVGLVLL